MIPNNGQIYEYKFTKVKNYLVIWSLMSCSNLTCLICTSHWEHVCTTFWDTFINIISKCSLTGKGCYVHQIILNGSSWKHSYWQKYRIVNYLKKKLVYHPTKNSVCFSLIMNLKDQTKYV